MKAIKKYIPLVIAFALGAFMTYLLMSLSISNQRLTEALEKSKSTVDHTKVAVTVDPKEKEQKHWLRELEEQQAAESQERTKQQQSQGDKLKSQFDQFAE
jgi:predicted alpha/beta superfamily hydrolase